jgi:GalNAc5-diNAcBac-PP-undecaprenol beta-1,3-glucosyltransferase
MQRPLVSVAIATFNRASWVPRAIASALRQTVQNVEVLVVDDGSKDIAATANAVAAIGDPRVRYLRHSFNRGLPAARNTAINAAAGEYIAFLDDDDEWLPHKLERQLKALRVHDAVLTAARLRESGRVKRFHKPVVELADLRQSNPFDPSSLIVRAHLMKALLFDERLRVGEDWDAFIRIAQIGSIAYLPEPLIVYSESPGGRMTTEAAHMSLSDLERRMQVVRKHEKFFGRFWFRYHVAAFLLSHFRSRHDKLARTCYAVRRCGVFPVSRLLLERARGAFGGAHERVGLQGE